MAGEHRTGLTAAEGRRFAFTLAVAFAVLGALLKWRGADTATTVLAWVATTFAALGLLVPSRLGPLERAWMALAHALSRITTPIFMGVVYFLVITPTALLLRAIGRAPLRPSAGATHWRTRPEGERRSELSRQF